jgi:hypothetical protein
MGVPLTYEASTDRLPHPASPPALGDAGTLVLDPVYGTRMLRLTDGATTPTLSYRVANEFWGNDWNTDSTLFYIQSSNSGLHFYRFDPKLMTATPVAAPMLNYGGFSRSAPNLFIGLHNSYVVATYDFNTQQRTDVFSLLSIVPGATGYVLGVQQARNGLYVSVFGGPQQDKMPYLITYDAATQTHHLIDVTQGTLDGVSLGITFGGGLHTFKVDASGRWIQFAVSATTVTNYLYDVQSGTITTGGAGASGSGAFIHGAGGSQESYNWAVSDFATPTVSTPLISPLPTPLDSNVSASVSWMNAVAGASAPLIVETMRRPADTGPLREWDDELIAVRTDGVQSTVWRFAHNFNAYTGTIYSDNFYYLFIPRVSQNGMFAIIDSNWMQSLGTDSTGQPRTDVFIVELKNPCGP